MDKKMPVRLILIYTLIAALLAAITSPIVGSSLFLTALEVFMIVHLAKQREFKLSFREIGFAATTIWGLSTVLKDVVLELMTFIPGPGWIARVIVAMVFVFFLGVLADMHFR
jgi:uncharacterized protein (DUF697 family)